MLDLSKYQSIGEALREALDQYANEVCLIEADREREKERLTYRDFKERAHPLSKALQDGGFSAAARASTAGRSPSNAASPRWQCASTRAGTVRRRPWSGCRLFLPWVPVRRAAPL